MRTGRANLHYGQGESLWAGSAFASASAWARLAGICSSLPVGHHRGSNYSPWGDGGWEQHWDWLTGGQFVIAVTTVPLVVTVRPG
jgi:hypothetical protein